MEPTKNIHEICAMLLNEDPIMQQKGEYFMIEYQFVKRNEMLMEWDLGRLFPVPKGDRLRYGELLGSMRNYYLNLKKILLAEEIDPYAEGTESEAVGNDNSTGTE